MTKGYVIYYAAMYIVFGLLLFVMAWKDAEEENRDFRRMPKMERVAIRLCSIALWPVLLLMIIAEAVRRVLVWIWDCLTE